MQVIDNMDRVIADIEIINIVENALRKDVDTFLDMKNLNTVYSNLLGNEEKFHCNYKKQIKSWVLQKVSDVQFSQPKSCREAEIICSEAKHDQVINQYKNASDTYNKSLVAASLIRHDILNKNRWKFAVSLNAKKKKNVDVQIKNISEIVITSTKSKKQVNNASGEFRENVETPLSVGLGLYIHQQT